MRSPPPAPRGARRGRPVAPAAPRRRPCVPPRRSWLRPPAPSAPRLRAVREGVVALRVAHRRERRRQDVRRERALRRRPEADEVAALLEELAAVVLAVEALL